MDIIRWAHYDVLAGLAAIVTGYLLGSFPTAYIVAKLRKGIDIREVDVRNVGAATVIRQVGRLEGFVVGVIDMAKEAGAILIAQALSISEMWLLGAGFAALLGHCFPLYIGFRCGQGVATVLSPQTMAVILALMAIALFLTRRVFFITCIVAPFLPVFIWLFDGPPILIFYSLAIIAFVAYRNRRGLKEL